MTMTALEETKMFYAGDAWGWSMGFLFAIADVLTDRGLDVPKEWGFRQSPFGSDKEAFEYGVISAMTPEEIEELGDYFWKFSRTCKRLGFYY